MVQYGGKGQTAYSPKIRIFPSELYKSYMGHDNYSGADITFIKSTRSGGIRRGLFLGTLDPYPKTGGAGPFFRREKNTCVRYSKTFPVCCLRVHTTVMIRSLYFIPHSDWLPFESFLAITQGLSPLSARLFVGSTPSCSKKVHRVVNLFSKS